MKLREATTAERNAAFDAVFRRIGDLIGVFVPAFFQQQAIQAITSPEGRKRILDMVDAALEAAEKEREKAK